MGIRKDRGLSDPQYRDILDRFGIAQDSPKSEDHQERLDVQQELRDMIFYVGVYMTRRISNNKARFQALNKLEESLMWGGKAIFADELPGD